jgi:hypothetical protein
MGAWGTDSFENDMACDWKYDLEESDDLQLVEDTFTELLEDGEEYLDSDFACAAIAACEVLARLKGNFGQQDAYTESLDEWIANHPQEVAPHLLAAANQSLDRILADDSELKELWEDSDGFEEWKGKVENLRQRMNA